MTLPLTPNGEHMTGKTNRKESREQLRLFELIAIGVGGMIGGGIFSVLGLAVDISGHAAPLAFGIGSLIALAAGYSYIRLALTYRNDGASFTYLEHAFPNQPNVAGITGWTVIVGYIGTLALYAFTFGAYGADLLGMPQSGILRMALSVAVLVFFMLVNLAGTRVTGKVEDLVVYVKILLLGVFAVAGFTTTRVEYLTPVLDKGATSVFIAGALIFVAYEGFQLITNAVCETRDVERNIPRGIYGSILITSVIYIVLAVVAIGNLTVPELVAAEEYALAAAAKPVLGEAGIILVGLAALLATSSAINATSFGAARMMAEMAREARMPRAFSFRRDNDVPWVAIVVLALLAIGFTLASGLEVIAAFSSLTFLLVSIGVSIANLRLRAHTNCRIGLVILGLVLMGTTVLLLLGHLWTSSRGTLIWILAIYGAVLAAELLFSKRRLGRCR
ncbi:amino acid permease [Rhodospirillaceae bacterium AH-315-P19]|nr:amino acid permease [Rhodospirillaceae bacterium AH-315-P19]